MRRRPNASPDLVSFSAVDRADDAEALIAFLEASDKLPAVRAVKSRALA